MRLALASSPPFKSAATATWAAPEVDLTGSKPSTFITVEQYDESEGNAGVMIEDWEEVGMNGIVASAVAGEAGVNGNYVVEYLVSMKPAWESGMFAGTNAELGT